MRWAVALLLLAAIPSSAQVPSPGPGRAPAGGGTGGGGGISIVCAGNYQPGFIASFNPTDPGCGVAGDRYVLAWVHDGGAAGPFTSVGMNVITQSGDQIGCFGTCTTGVFERTLTNAEQWDGDISVTAPATDGAMLVWVVVSGVSGPIVAQGLNGSVTETPSTPPITGVTGSAGILHLGATSRTGHLTGSGNSMAPPNTTCLDLDGSGNCVVGGGTNKYASVAMAYEAGVDGESTGRTFGSISSANSSYGLQIRLSVGAP